MSRLTDLLASAKAKDPQLGADLEREFRALSSRLSFGLNFERHRPEAVELPQRPVRRGDKVRVLPPRGSSDRGDQRIWLVRKILRTGKSRQAELALLPDGAETCESKLEDVVVVAEFGEGMRPDLRSHTIWDTIRNTIEDPALTLYLVLDEAHRGMGAGPSAEKSTIVRRLINGAHGVPGIPVVWGISATVERFTKAIEGMQGRSTLPAVTVDAARVQDSGLLKDTIALDIPDEAKGDFDTVLVRRAADKLRDITAQWDAYTEQQGTGETVIPLLVLQVPNTPNHNDIGQALDVIAGQWPDLPPGSVAHVFGEHKTQQFGSHSVPYIEPQRVQGDTWVRVLIAKDAISTGWDCPRAEVMVSFRPANDQTYIAQNRIDLQSPMARFRFGLFIVWMDVALALVQARKLVRSNAMSQRLGEARLPDLLFGENKLDTANEAELKVLADWFSDVAKSSTNVASEPQSPPDRSPDESSPPADPGPLP